MWASGALVPVRCGEIFLEIGNAADSGERSTVPVALRLPDPLTFAGGSRLRLFTHGVGPEGVGVRLYRIDRVL